MERIGLIQTRGIGDVIIAVPIAQFYIDRGAEVFWPVDARWCPFVQAAFPQIRFLPVSGSPSGSGFLDYFYLQPKQLLRGVGCDREFCLYSHLAGLAVVNEKLARSLKFDEYKYAVTGVPFAEKWNLRMQRNAEREQALFDRLGIDRPYAVLHETGLTYTADIQLPADVAARHQVIRVSELSENPFDWLLTIERADLFACVDSVFANLAEQLGLCRNKYFYFRSDVRATPVLRDGWQFR